MILYLCCTVRFHGELLKCLGPHLTRKNQNLRGRGSGLKKIFLLISFYALQVTLMSSQDAAVQHVRKKHWVGDSKRYVMVSKEEITTMTLPMKNLSAKSKGDRIGTWPAAFLGIFLTINNQVFIFQQGDWVKIIFEAQIKTTSFFLKYLKNMFFGTSLEVQWLGLCTSTAGGTGSIPGWGTMIPHAVRCVQKNKFLNMCIGGQFLRQRKLQAPKRHL